MSKWISHRGIQLALMMILFFARVKGACTGNISLCEYTGLQELFESTHGSNWKWNTVLSATTQWYFPATFNNSNLVDPCRNAWQGVSCSDSSLPLGNSGVCTISSVYLSSMNLVGSIPSALSLCSNMQVAHALTPSLYFCFMYLSFSITKLLFYMLGVICLWCSFWIWPSTSSLEIFPLNWDHWLTWRWANLILFTDNFIKSMIWMTIVWRLLYHLHCLCILIVFASSIYWQRTSFFLS